VRLPRAAARAAPTIATASPT